MLDKILNEQIENLASDAYLIVDYNEFCDNPDQFKCLLENKLQSKWEFAVGSVNTENKPFQTSKRLDDSNLNNQIKQYVEKWKDKI